MTKFALFLSVLIGSISANARDVVNEQWVGKRALNGETCVVSHRQLDYSYPELFISFHAAPGESFNVPDAGLVEAKGIDFKTYQDLLYGAQLTPFKALKRSYEYQLASQVSGNSRVISIDGISVPDGNRKSQARIEMEGGAVKSVSVQKLAKSFLRWSVTFEDTCSQFQLK